MRVQRERLKRSYPNHPAEVYYSACHRARTPKGGFMTYHGWGATPTEARLDLLWQMGRRRTSPNLAGTSDA
jgi:hypothetical protein